MGVYLCFVTMVLAHLPSRTPVVAPVLAEGTFNPNFWTVVCVVVLEKFANDDARAKFTGHRRLVAFLQVAIHLVKFILVFTILALNFPVLALGDVKIQVLSLDFVFAAPVVRAVYHLKPAIVFVGSEIIHLALPVTPFSWGFVGIIELLDKVCLLSLGLQATSLQLHL
jgi:hypothetical protein